MNSQTISANKYKYITQIGTPLKDGRQKKHIIKATIITAVCHIIIYAVTNSAWAQQQQGYSARVAAQQSFTTKLTQLQSVIDSAATDIRNDAYAAFQQITYLNLEIGRANERVDEKLRDELYGLANTLIFTAAEMPRTEAHV